MIDKFKKIFIILCSRSDIINKKFKEVYAEYIKYIDYKLKNQTKRTLKERFDKKILPYFSEFNINEITESDYLNWQLEIYKFGYSNNYNSNLHYLMSSFFEYCIKFHNLNRNIPRIVGNFQKRYEKKEYQIYSIKQFKRFIKYVDDNMYKQFFNLMFFTGVRPGEAMALRFSDYSNGYITINHTIDEHGSRSLGTPKNLSSIRTIKLDKKLEKDIIRLKKYYIEKYNTDKHDYFIFGGLKPLSPTTINRHKEKAQKLANLPKIKLHEFRHSHATLLISKNIMIKEVSRRLGHSNCKITLDVYTHATSEHEKRVARTLNFIRLF